MIYSYFFKNGQVTWTTIILVFTIIVSSLFNLVKFLYFDRYWLEYKKTHDTVFVVTNKNLNNYTIKSRYETIDSIKLDIEPNSYTDLFSIGDSLILKKLEK